MNGSLDVKNINFEYPCYHGTSAVKILDDLSFNPEVNGVNIVFGGLESGKSTLAMIIAALIPLHTGGKLSGSIELDGIDIINTAPSELIEHCGVVFQDPERQTVTTECFEEAAFALESLGVPEVEIKERVSKAFENLDIKYLLDSSTSDTSGGEKKKLALASMLAVNPDLWILDETFEELDNPSRIHLFELLKECGKTIIILTSKYFSVFERADAFFILENGKVSEKEHFPLSTEFRKCLIKSGIIFDSKNINKKTDPEDNRGGVILHAENLSYSYNRVTESEYCGFSLNIDSFSLHENEVLSIVGRNGCGKSTLARLLCGLAAPSSGFIGVPDKVPTEFLNSYCAYMFQNPDYQIFLPTVFDELAFGLKEAGCSNSVIKSTVEETIADFKLPSADTPPALMSFSARKRLQAAVYYLLRRPVFILDEADTGLSFSDFLELVGKLKKSCRGIIIITHNLELASVVSDRVVGMSAGKIYEDITDFNPDRLNEWLIGAGAGSYGC